MKILFDYQTFTLQEFGGISRYFSEIYNHLRVYPDVHPHCTPMFSNNEYIRKARIIKHSGFFYGKRFKGKVRLMLALNKKRSRMTLDKNDFDIFHPTYYDPYYFNLKISKPLVITCLDLIHEKFIMNDEQTISNKRKVFERADAILAISQNTKNDLVEYYKIDPEKIFVTYLASSLKTDIKSTSGEQFFLYVGMRNLYKNFTPFVEALAPLLSENKDLFLYCAGGGDFTVQEMKIFEQLKIVNRVKYQSAGDENLKKLYSSAIALLYPSKYEGFGIPLVEAMNCGCPVAASNSSSLPEIGENAALYFDPNNKDEIYDISKLLLNNQKLRLELISKGYDQAAKFSWENTALETFHLYKKLV